MKVLVALALLGLACGAPEADPWGYYGRGYYGRGYWGGYRGYYYGKRSADEPAVSGPNPDADAEPHGYYGGYYRPYYYGYYYGKRQAGDEPAASGPNPDADAEPHGWVELCYLYINGQFTV